MGIPAAKNFNTIVRLETINTWTDDFRDPIGAFPVYSQLSNVWFDSVLEYLAKHEIYFVKSSWMNF